MSWIILVVAGLFETGFATCLGMAKINKNESLFWYTGFVICLAISMYLLVIASRNLPIGTAYAVWTGIGAAGTVLVGIYYFNEPATTTRVLFLSTLIISIIGLKFVS